MKKYMYQYYVVKESGQLDYDDYITVIVNASSSTFAMMKIEKTISTRVDPSKLIEIKEANILKSL